MHVHGLNARGRQADGQTVGQTDWQAGGQAGGQANRRAGVRLGAGVYSGRLWGAIHAGRLGAGIGRRSPFFIYLSKSVDTLALFLV